MTIREWFEEFAREKELPVAELNLEPEAPNQLCIMMNGENGVFEGHGVFLEEERLFLFYTIVGVRIPADRRERLSSYLLSLNYKLKTAAFFIEDSTGELTVRTVQYLTGADWEKRELLETLVLGCGKTADYFYPQLMKEIFG